MNALLILIPVALLLGLVGLVSFVWALRSGQFEDLDGASVRILIDEKNDDPQSGQDASSSEPTTSR